MMSTIPRIQSNLIYFYDLPQGEFTSTQLAKIIKDKTGYDIERQPQVRRDFNKPFYTAVVKINDNAKFNEVCKALRYFDINGKNCRALPFQNELLGSNVQRLAENNMFVRRIPKSDSAAILENTFSKYGEIISCKVSLGSDHESKGYGFVCFRDAAATQKALEETQGAETRIGVKFAPKDKKDFRKVYNNIYVKNMPANWTVEEAKNQFSPFGHITSVHLGES
jgi:polyadenylate-binding protein